MAGLKISELPAVSSPLLTDILAEVQGGVTYQVTLDQLATLFGMSGGILAMINGGTGAALVADDGAIVYSTASELALLASTSTAGQVLLSGSSSAPTWSTATFANTYTINSIVYASAADTLTGLAPANSSVLASDLTGVPTWLGPLTNGQIIIGSTSATPVAAILTAGPGISISNGAGSITISGTGSGIGWTEVTSTSQAMSADSGYVANNSSLVTFTLPVTAAFGTAISLIGKGSGGWSIAQNSGQNIQFGSASSTIGVGGSISSTNRYDSIDLICTTANTTWTVLGAPQGVLTVV